MRLLWLVFTLTMWGCYNDSGMGGTPFRCSNDEFPECPRGYHCDDKLCLRDHGWLEIPKQESYEGDKEDPGLDTSECPDANYEPNDEFSEALQVSTGTLANLAICPRGDIDLYKGDAKGNSVRATITYKVATGDLDLAFVEDTSGFLLAADASPRDNGCVALPSGTGAFWVGVIGVGHKTMNNYTLKIDTSTTSLVCP